MLIPGQNPWADAFLWHLGAIWDEEEKWKMVAEKQGC